MKTPDTPSTLNEALAIAANADDWLNQQILRTLDTTLMPATAVANLIANRLAVTPRQAWNIIARARNSREDPCARAERLHAEYQKAHGTTKRRSPNNDSTSTT